MDQGRAKKLMKDAGLDAVVVTRSEVLTYVTGAYVYTQRTLPARMSAALLTADGEATYVFCGIEDTLVQDQTWIKNLRPYIEFVEDPFVIMAEIMAKAGLNGSKIGLETQYLGYDQVKKIANQLPQATFVDNFDFLNRLKMIKTPREIELLGRGAVATRRAIESAFVMAKPGDTEKTIVNNIVGNLMALGADETSFLTVATGKNGSRAHHVAGDARLKDGEVVRSDIGAFFSGYYSDLGRTYVVGKPSSEQAHAFRALRAVQEEVILSMTVGTPVRDVFERCKAGFLKNKLEFWMPHIGHGIGTELHEYPILAPTCSETLQENMVFNVEPYYRSPTGEGFFSEDMVLITKSGPKILSAPLAPVEIPVIA